jgi:hypothetical protein
MSVPKAATTTTSTATKQNHAQPAAAAGMSKLKKIEWYAGQLIADATAKEKSGSVEEAIVLYLNAADMLLLLAKGQDNYTVWKGYSDKALQCQSRSRMLMAARK